MEKQNKKLIGFLASFAIIAIALCSFASALGASYSPEGLSLSPGESGTFKIYLQNVGSNMEDTNVVVSVVGRNDISSLSTSKYFLKAGSFDDTYATVLVKVPQDAAVGTDYQVKLSIATAGNGVTGNMISIGTALTIGFPVKVVAAQTSAQPAPVGLSNTTMGIIAVIVVLIVLWILFSLMNKKKKRR